MPRKATADALIAEAAALSSVVTRLDSTDLSPPSPCSPWTVGALICHVLIGADRIAQALAEPEDAADDLISTAAYYRPDERFSATTNADRIATAQALADRLVPTGPRALAAELDRRCAESAELLTAAPTDRAICTRHGDRMLLTDFARTRVVELGVHGLDAAIGLNRQPWLTDEAAGVLEDLLLPEGGAQQVRATLGCDRTGLIARLTGRIPLSAADAERIAGRGVTRLALG
jgi:uncharacterized protein (TIGR03083 family)